ncbi:MAG: DMT family transporter [Bacteroidota bacterium]
MNQDRHAADRTSHRSFPGALYFVLFIQSLLASGTHLVAKVVVVEVDAFVLTLVRSLIATVGMGLILLAAGRRISIRKEDYPLVLLLSFLAVPVNQFLFLVGIRYTTASNAALLYATTPILVLLISRWLLKERLTRRKVTGVVLGFLGVMVVIFERGVDASLNNVTGNLIIYVAVIAWGLYTVLGKRLVHRYGPIHATSITLILGTVLFLPIGLIPTTQFAFGSLSGSGWLQILYLGLITSVVAYMLWYYALGRIEAGKVALFTYLQPILTTIMAVILLGQDVTPAFLIGGTVALGGVIIAQFA